jgi:hypothetical protein
VTSASATTISTGCCGVAPPPELAELDQDTDPLPTPLPDAVVLIMIEALAR